MQISKNLNVTRGNSTHVMIIFACTLSLSCGGRLYLHFVLTLTRTHTLLLRGRYHIRMRMRMLTALTCTHMQVSRMLEPGRSDHGANELQYKESSDHYVE